MRNAWHTPPATMTLGRAPSPATSESSRQNGRQGNAQGSVAGNLAASVRTSNSADGRIHGAPDTMMKTLPKSR